MANVQLVLTVRDDGTVVVDRFARVTEQKLTGISTGVEQAASRSAAATRRSFDDVSRDLDRVGSRIRTFGTDFSLLASAPVLAIGAASTKAALDFESSFAGVRKTIDATDEELGQIRQGIRDLAAGPNAIPIEVNELNRIAEIAGQIGVKAPELVGFTATIAKLGATTNLAGEQGAVGLARFSNIMGTSISDSERLASTIVELGNKFAATEGEILEMGLRIAGAGRQLNLSEADVLAYAAALASVGVEAEAGGTAVSRTFIEIAKSVRTGDERLRTFAETAGLSVEEFRTLFEEDAAEAVRRFIEGLGTLEERGGNVFGVLEQLGLENVRVRDALLRSSAAADQMTAALQQGSDAWSEATALQTEFGKRAETNAAQLQLARQRINDVAIDLGGQLAPVLLRVANLGADFAQAFGEMDEGTRDVVIGVGAVVAATGPLLIVTGTTIRLFGQASAATGTFSAALLRLALMNDTAAVAMARTTSLTTVWTSATLAQKAGMVGLVATVGALSFGLGRLFSQLSGIDAALEKMFERDLQKAPLPSSINSLEVSVASLRKAVDKGLVVITNEQVLALEAAEGLLKRIAEASTKTVVIPSGLRTPPTFASGADLLPKEVRDAAEAARQAVESFAAPLLHAQNELRALSQRFPELAATSVAAGGTTVEQLERLKKAVALVDPDKELQSLTAQFPELAAEIVAAGGTTEQQLAKLKAAIASTADEERRFASATQQAVEGQADLEKILASLGLATEAMGERFARDLTAQVELAVAQGVDLSSILEALGPDILAMGDAVATAGGTAGEGLQKLIDRVTILKALREDFEPLAIPGFEGGEFEAPTTPDFDLEAFERFNGLAQEAAEPPATDQWQDFFDELIGYSEFFVETIGEHFGDLANQGISSLSHWAGQAVVFGQEAAGSFGRLIKGVAAQSIALLLEWGLRRLVVGKLTAATVASEATAEFGKAFGLTFANTFASMSAAPFPINLTAPAVAAAHLGLVSAGTPGAAAAGAGFGAALGGGAIGLREGGLTRREGLFHLSEDDRQEAVLPLEGPAADHVASTLGLTDIQDVLADLSSRFEPPSAPDFSDEISRLRATVAAPVPEVLTITGGPGRESVESQRAIVRAIETLVNRGPEVAISFTNAAPVLSEEIPRRFIEAIAEELEALIRRGRIAPFSGRS
jgi:TP901 family phage tail tape measure protein